LPDIVEGITIDASTQSGYATTPVVELVGLVGDGLHLTGTAGGSTVRALAIGGFTGDGIELEAGADRSRIVDNHIGLDAAGTTANALSGMGIRVAAAETQIGDIGGGNHVGASMRGIVVAGAAAVDNQVVANVVGTGPTGAPGLGTVIHGVAVEAGAARTVVGGPSAAHRNVIVSSGEAGVVIDGETTDDVVVEGNWIGLWLDGLTAMGNAASGVGVDNDADSSSLIDNVIVASGQDGISITGASDSTSVQGNFIGTDSGLIVSPGSGANGVLVGATATNTQVGGLGAGQGNTIAGSGQSDPNADGVRVLAPKAAINVILSNEIYDSAGLAIDADVDGPTVNDAPDIDEAVNHPTIDAVVASGGSVTIDFTVDAAAGAYHVQIFGTPAADPTGYGEADTLLATYFIAAHPGGSASYTTSVPGTHSTRLSVSITEEIAPSSYGSTSEMSRALASDSDGDGVFDIFEDTNVDLDGDPSTNPGPDTDGDLTPDYLDNDDDGDGVGTRYENPTSGDLDGDGTPDYLDTDDDGDGAPTADESADPNADGDPADALDTDADLTPDYLDAVGGADCTAQTQVPAIECNYLVALASATNSPGWTANSGWLAHSLPCLWPGVTCDATNVTGLDLSNSGLVGSIPAGIDDLAALQTIDLSVNRLSGTFPADLAAIPMLVELRLNDNELTGSLPLGFGSIASLTVLDVETNRLGGSLPADLGGASALTHLNVGHNALSGSIPAGLGSLASLVVLDLQNNAFSGSIPTTFGALDSVTDLRLQNNVLTGAIPVELGDMASVEWMMLHDNGLSGSIPVELGDATTLQGLSLHGNLLSGAVPVQLSNLASLASLTLQGNAGLGSVPGAVVDLPGLLVFAR
ncbi:MAG: hypothetical protein R2710_00090, partial [Acidimicrobiales bacterium]